MLIARNLLLLSLFLLFSNSIFCQNQKQASMQDWVYPYDVHKVQVSDGVEVAYVDEGAGAQTFLFLHGMGSYLKSWTKNIEVLKQNYRCIALDLPGYGKSSKGNYTHSMSFFADAVQQFIEKLNLKNVVLVGHSMGGQISMHLVLRKLPNVEKLILIAPAGFETFTEAEKLWFKNVYTAAFIKATPTEQIIKNFEINFHQMPEDARFMIEDRLFMRETVEYDTYCEMIPQCVQGMLNEPVYERLPEITIPTLILYGKNDLLIPNKLLHPALTTAQVAEAGHKQLPNSQLQLFDACGHFVQWECAEGVNEAIQAFAK